MSEQRRQSSDDSLKLLLLTRLPIVPTSPKLLEEEPVVPILSDIAPVALS